MFRFFLKNREHITDLLILSMMRCAQTCAALSMPNFNSKTTTMKTKLSSIRFPLITAAGLALFAISSHAQNITITDTLTGSPGSGVYDYTFTLNNTGPESIESLWFGWTVGNFNVANPTSAGNLQGWTSSVVGNSIQYGGTSGTAIASGHSGTFTFDSTATPSQIAGMNGWASVLYGVNASQFAIENTTADSLEFTPNLVLTPEPSTIGLFAVGSLGFLGAIRRKLPSQ